MNSVSTGYLIYNARLIYPHADGLPGWALTEGRRIAALGFGAPPEFEAEGLEEKIDANGYYLLPGFIDLHTHGAGGHDSMDASPEGLRAMGRFYAEHGTTAFLATTWTAERHQINAALETIRQVQGRIPGGATLLGAHLEGPYLNPARSGAQEARLIRLADRAEALQFLESGVVSLITLAPEFPENQWLIEECVRRGITVAAGHSEASYAEMQTAVELGLRQVTHCFNAMLGLGHREPGTAGAALALPELSCELVADNIHVHPAVQKILFDVKGPEHVILVTDSVLAAGLPAGEYPLNNRDITIQAGAARLADGVLAGSILTMEKALQNACQASGRTLGALWPASSLNAARLIGISARKGNLEAGKDADLVLLDEAFQVHLTMAEGEIIYQKRANA